MYLAPILILFLAQSLSNPFHAHPMPRRPARGRCVHIRKCEPVMKLVNDGQIQNIYAELNRQICGYEGDEPKIICRVPKSARRLSTPKTTPPPTTTTTTAKTSQNPFDDPRLDHEACGPVPMATRIFGGTATRVFEFPWMALLAYRDMQSINGDQPDFKCAATIVTKKYVMTAAHCVSHLPANFKLVAVRVGEHDLTRDKDCEMDEDYYDDGPTRICADRHQNFRVEKIHVHPDYSPVTLQNDIALVRLRGTLKFTPSVRPVCLPLDSSSRRLGNSATVVGWGATKDFSAAISPVLMKVRLPVLPIRACELSYRDQPYVKLGYSQLCAGGSSGKDSCNGDSGGPLQTVVLYNGRPRTVQHGIVSFGRKNCAVLGSPAVYTKVVDYLDWILDTIGESDDELEY